MKQINAKVYLFVYHLNDLTKKWLANVNKQIKENGIEILSFNKNDNIHIRYDNAQAKYSPEVEAQIAKIKAKNEPINKGQKVAKIIIDSVDATTQENVQKFLEKGTIDADKNEMRAASGIAKTKSHR